MIRRTWRYRDLVVSLTRRQYQLRYRQSFIGFTWAIITPIATLGAASLVFRRVAGLGTGHTPYAVSTLAALVPWTFFATSVGFGVVAVVNAQSMVTRIPFPRVALPLSMIGTALLDLVISLALFVVVAFLTGAGIPASAVWLPVLLGVEFMLITGIVLFGSAINVFARDLRMAVPLFLQMWLLITPVLYPLSAAPHGLRGWFLVNPMTGVVENARRVLGDGRGPDLGLLVPAMIGAVLLFVVGTWYFSATESRFADVI
jgi:lipopolysaccharide transport system permease protein